MLRRTICALLVACSGASYGAPVRTEHVEAELVAARTAIEAGKPALVALRLKMIPHWHTYWRNPGDSGQPTAIRVEAAGGLPGRPDPVAASAAPACGAPDELRLRRTRCCFPSRSRFPRAQAAARVLRAQANWLVCNEERCIPEEAELALALPVGPGEPSVWAKAIERTRSTLPVRAETLGDWQFSAASGPAHVELSLIPPAGVARHVVHVFPVRRGQDPQRRRAAFRARRQRLRLRIPKAQQPVGAFTRVSGPAGRRPRAGRRDFARDRDRRSD